MDPKRKFIIVVVVGATLVLSLLITRLLNAFEHKTPQESIISTNNIISSSQQKKLPKACQQSINLMNCVIGQNTTSGANDGLIKNYMQTLSQRNVIQDSDKLRNTCAEYYSYLTQTTGLASTISSCLSV